ncbi:MAG: NUDIX hydrolase, partial [Nanoarchaeota archaeon]|nr:NUDIX hydrolase [Nanoarchaeota archaeon]
FRKGRPNKYLLIHNKKTGNITFPAGGREEHETSSRQSLEREIREETGLLPKDYKVIPTQIIHEFIYNSKKKGRTGQHAKQPVYLVATSKRNLIPEDSDAKIEGWYTAEEIIERLTFNDSKEVFKKALARLSDIR